MCYCLFSVSVDHACAVILFITILGEMELKTTLDEKRAKLSNYRGLLHDIKSHQPSFVALKSQLEALPEKNKKAEDEFKKLADRYDTILKKAGKLTATKI